MTTITFRVSEKEKAFIQEMAKFNGISISELSRKQIIEGLENQIDLQSYERAIKMHQLKDESISFDEMKKELDL
ncbi:toxin-antitoxin system antitoxin subunit [Listeria monocytogenes]|nr:toxin-antitoxin system antitoxin subunit [Listeria monocytogenes]EKB1221381.1 CopG family transcriptional regulator [Listeria monocytogenes]